MEKPGVSVSHTHPWDPSLTASLTGVGPGPSAHDKRLSLRAALAGAAARPGLPIEPLVLPGATDALGARLIEQAGFAAVYATGAGLANAVYGLPDLGLISQTEVVDHAGRLSEATGIPLICDADTGYGGPLSAMRTVRLLERAGVAGLQLEDQEMPKRCGHFDAHTLIPSGHMETKIAAACDARADDALVIIARTDARSAYGIDEAIERGRAYVAAGADALFIEAPRTVEELALVGRELAGTPLIVNVVEGGKTPQLELKEYAELGFGVVLFANYLMRSMHLAGREALAHLREHGETASRADRMASWQERQSLFNLPAFSAAETALDQELGRVE
ncbi:2-methylisocitrate lyase-like PEP mutase family enzyme [Actinocorallia herbida]|uniref:2-methylisocitrate lyase-like PEP mutase family enzyme n=1 Tax=Actinocorallia herbida TaxID=58109 RepID=A0A3N1CY05_9ACTN|nr:oxaloacetate decarboxylase [Actinocorallia herbida]ROO85608.1 2-methylisocitrate lyase-like PEP mutase family enzyme [Actinocorallia herbida]